MSNRRKYDQESRKREGRMYLDRLGEGDISQRAARLEVSRLLGINEQTLRGWVRAQVGEGTTTATGESLDAENARLRKENAQLRRANEILKTASAFSRLRSRVANSDRNRICQCLPHQIRGRADPYRAGRTRHWDRPVDLLRPRRSGICAHERGTARRLVGLKGYATNIPAAVMDAPEVIASYHDLWQVEASFRMSKTDLRARPIFHLDREAIEAHLTIVFAALAMARYMHKTTGVSLKKIIRTLKPLQHVTFTFAGHEHLAADSLTLAAQDILTALEVQPD